VHVSNARNLYIAILISNYQKRYVLHIIAYILSSTKLEKRAEQVLPGSEGGGGRGKGWGQGEMAQTMYTYMNKLINKKNSVLLSLSQASKNTMSFLLSPMLSLQQNQRREFHLEKG
jgi:hypothetical protein